MNPGECRDGQVPAGQLYRPPTKTNDGKRIDIVYCRLERRPAKRNSVLGSDRLAVNVVAKRVVVAARDDGGRPAGGGADGSSVNRWLSAAVDVADVANFPPSTPHPKMSRGLLGTFSCWIVINTTDAIK